MSTAMACGAPFDGQGRSVQRALGSGPAIEWLGPDRVVLAAPGQRLELVRTGPLTPGRFVVVFTPLIGTASRFGGLDGQPIEMPGALSEPTLTVEGDRFTFETPA